MALRQGDPTARSLGRISLNPLVHMDLVGTVIMPLLQIFVSGIPLLGWAKPTPVNPGFFRRLRRGQILVSGAGPLSNAVLAALFTAGLFVAARLVSGSTFEQPVLRFLVAGIQLNVVLVLFNLLPLPPLDGSHVLEWTLPAPLGHRYAQMIAPYGTLLLLALVMSGLLGRVLSPVLGVVLRFLYAVAL
jgi:Zn-dependent protease